MKKSSAKSKPENKNRTKVVVVLGPTSSGKSELAVQLAQVFKGEVVSADSRQIYKSIDISSSKVPGEWERRGRRRFFVYKGVLHHMVDLIPPRKQYTAGEYRKKAHKAIEGIAERGKVPIVAGGTGFYIDALIHGIEFPQVKPQKTLRRELEELRTEQLMLRLRALDPRRAREIDPNNRRRIIRAIEIVVYTKTQIPPLRHKHSDDPFDALRIGMLLTDEELKSRIHRVVEERVEAGVIDELKRIHRRGVSWRRLASLGMEYKHIANHIRGDLSIEEMKENMKKEYWRYVKRQMTWFKRDSEIIWIDAPEKAFPVVKDFLGREV